MVKVIFEPLNTLIVHDILKVKKDDLLRERITPSGVMPLWWCNGVLFSFASPPMVDEIVKDHVNGKIHWMEVHYFEMKEYVQVLELNDEHYGGPMKIRIIDTSNSELHQSFTKWLKDNKKL